MCVHARKGARRWVSECRACARRRRAAVAVRGGKERSRGRGGSGRRKKEASAGGGGVRTSGPTPVSESNMEAVAQMCGDSRMFSVQRGVWVQQVHVEVRKGKERSR